MTNASIGKSWSGDRTGGFRDGFGSAFVLLLVAAILFQAAICDAKTFYLDNKSGIVNGSSTYNPATRSNSGGSSLVYTSPWDAGQALSSGDTLYVRQGTYYAVVPNGGTGRDWTLGSLTIPDGVSGATVSGYNGEVAWISCGPSLTTVVGSANNALKIGGSNNTVRDLNIWGCAILWGTGGVLENCNVSGGWDHQSTVGGDAWYDVIRIGGTNNAVRNCLLHDNYNHGTVTDSANKAMVMHDHDENSIFEYNKFYNPVAGFSYVKYGRSGGTLQTTYRFNWFIGGGSAPFTGNGITTGQEIRFYQNVIQNSTNSSWFSPESTGTRLFKIFNNTFFNVAGSCFAWNTPGSHEFFNNIVYASSGAVWGVNYQDLATATSFFDYNDYYSTGSGSIRWGLNYKSYSPLSSWQSLGFDAHSVTSNPNFLNATGSFSVPSDFKRSSYTSNGRGSGYPVVMGAYVTGSETIGPTSGSAPPPPPTVPPQPQGVSATGGDQTVTVQWGSVSGATYYNIYYGTSAGLTTANGTRISNVTSPYVHLSLANGTTYFYIVTAGNSAGEGPPSNVVSATPSSASAKLPNPPSALLVQ